MHPLVRGAAAAAVLTALGSLDRAPAPRRPSRAPAGQAPRASTGCPPPARPGTLPEGPVCVRIPGEDEAARLALEADARRARRRRERGLGLDRIPRRPERPADPAAYVYPVGTPSARRGCSAASTATRARGAAAEQAGVHLAARPGEKVVAARARAPGGPGRGGVRRRPLRADRGDRARGGGGRARTRTYLLFHGRLDRADAGAVRGRQARGRRGARRRAGRERAAGSSRSTWRRGSCARA